MRLGAHESISGGLHLAFDRAQSVGCDAVQLFVKSSRAWAVKPLTEEEIRLFQERAAATGIHPAVGHASYLLNPAAPDENLWRKSRDTLIVELERCEALGIPYLVLHPGSHMGAGDEEGLRRVARAERPTLPPAASGSASSWRRRRDRGPTWATALSNWPG